MKLRKLLRYYPKYLAQKIKFKKLGGEITHNYMILDDYVASAGIASGHYFHQDLLVASFIKKNNPKKHIDIGSRIDGFVAHVASFREIDVIDIRNLESSEHENINFIQSDISIDIPKGYDLIIIKDVIQHWDDEHILKKLTELIKHNKFVYCINGYKFIRDQSKNNWSKRQLDKKYHYHPISFDKQPFIHFKKNIIDSKTRGAKQYILFTLQI